MLFVVKVVISILRILENYLFILKSLTITDEYFVIFMNKPIL